MASYSAAFLDLVVDQEDRRIDERPGIRRPSLTVIENHLSNEAAANPALFGWQTFRPNDDAQADAMEGMCRGQSHRRNMAARARQAATPITHAPLARPPKPSQLLPQRPSQPSKLGVTAEEKPRARRTADQPLYVARAAPKPIAHPSAPPSHPDGGLMASKWAPQAWGVGDLEISLTTARPQADINRITREEATAPTVFRTRPKQPPAMAPSANIGRPVAATTVAPTAVVVPSAPMSTTVAPSSIPKTVGTIEIRSTGLGNSSFYVDRYLAEAAMDMLKANAVRVEDIKVDQEVWRINGGV